MGIAEETLQILREAAGRSDGVIVSYSDGKDSRVVMDLCLRSFSSVHAFFMYLVPGLEFQEMQLDEAERRWGVKIARYPHWLVSRFIKNGTYCDPSSRYDGLREMKWPEICQLAMSDFGCDLVATGERKADSQFRRRKLTRATDPRYIYPIRGWYKTDLLGYMRLRKIPVPPAENRYSTGVDFTDISLLWMADTFPADFRKVCEVFPYAEAVVWKRRFYGG